MTRYLYKLTFQKSVCFIFRGFLQVEILGPNVGEVL